MIAYKFLSTGAVGPYTRFRWPVPGPAGAGAWVEAPDERPDHGVHACRAADLAFWQDAELWRAELDGSIVDGQRQVIATRARLLERVAGWDGAMSRRFGEACAARARDHAARALRAGDLHQEASLLEEARSLQALLVTSKALEERQGVPGNLASYLAEAIEFLSGGDTPCSTYISARAAVAASGQERAFALEREAQARWLAEQLGL